MIAGNLTSLQEREAVCGETLEGCASGRFCEGGLQ